MRSFIYRLKVTYVEKKTWYHSLSYIILFSRYVKATLFHKTVCDFVIANRGVVKLLELASTSVYAMLEKEMPLPVNKDTYCHISVALSEVYVSQDYDTEGRKKYEEQAEGIIISYLFLTCPSAQCF